jgi:hypothetical protein
VPPADLNWDAWLGPAPKRAFNKNRTFYRFRWFYDYSGGQVTNFGVHYMDAIHWALGHDAPLAVTAMGGKYAVEDNREIPDTLEVIWTYPGNTLVTFSQFNATAAPAARDRRVEIEFRGTKGTMLLFSNGYEIVPDEITPNEFPARTPIDRQYERGYRTGAKPLIEPVKSAGGNADTVHHARNFLDCVKSRAACNCDIETGHRSTSTTLIANIAHKTKSYLEWDRKADGPTTRGTSATYRYRSPSVAVKVNGKHFAESDRAGPAANNHRLLARKHSNGTQRGRAPGPSARFTCDGVVGPPFAKPEAVLIGDAHLNQN